MTAVIFDLDYTLFDNRQYIFSAFKKISEYLSNRHSISEEIIYNKLISLLEEKTSMYLYLFDDLLKYLKIEDDVKKIVKIFNTIDVNLKPYQDTIGVLKILKSKKLKLGIITDGNVKRQKRKIKILGIKKFFNWVIYTKKIGFPKPSKIPYMRIIKKLKINPLKSYYIGDNPNIDFKGAKELGFTTIRLLKGEFMNVPSNDLIDFEINTLNKLIEFIKV